MGRSSQYSKQIRNLQLALNKKGCNILFSRKQFFSEKYNYAMTLYIISQSVLDGETGKKRSIELFSTTNQVHCLLFMRNLWYLVNGQEVPETNLDDFNAKWKEVTMQNLFIAPYDD